jgi:hypothetical protein
MGIPRLILLEFIQGLGRPGLAGGLLLLAALGYGIAGAWPAREEAGRLREKAGRMEAALTRPPVAPGSAEQEPPRADSPYAALSSREDVTRWIERIYDLAAAEGIALARGEYALAPIADTRLVRYRILLPVKGDYPRIRRFVASAQGAVPGLGLEDLSLRRQGIAEGQVEALIRFSLYLAKP